MPIFEDFPINVKLFYLINHSRNELLDLFFSKFYLLGKGWVLLPIFVCVLIFARRKAWLFVYAMLLSTILVHTLKFLSKQPRPASLLEDVYLIEPLYRNSFPSGDTAMAFALFAFFLHLDKRIGSLFLVYALLIGYGRIYVGAHFPLDVFAGAVIGMISFLIALHLVKKNAGSY